MKTHVPRSRRFAAGSRHRLAMGLSALLGLGGCRATYVVRSGWFQAELLASRQPIDEVRARGVLSAEQVRALDLIAAVKRYGAEIGLSATENYETIAWDWPREIWNVSGCDPLAFEARSWWFPVVGRIPYLGYFREKDARRQADRLTRAGLDVYVRTAGAYSTLGWFRDPILPGMLGWSQFDLASTVLHELAHATVWVRGSVRFNESFASFVGDEAAFDFLETRHGSDGEILIEAHQRQADRRIWRALLHELATDLETLYADPTSSPAHKLERKAEILASLPERVDGAGFANPERFQRAVSQGTWNNARLLQFRTYNDHQEDFAALLARHDGALLPFMHDIQRLTRRVDDPFVALQTHLQETARPR